MNRWIKHLRDDQSGTAAVEFAFVAPSLLALFFSIVTYTLALQTQNALQIAAERTARCVAIGSSDCASVTTGCDSASPAVCYAETVATSLGVTSIAGTEVAVTNNYTYGGLSFTQVKIAHPWTLFGFTPILGATALYPN